MANRGISIEHDGRFGKQERKLMATLKFPEQFSKKIDMKKVHVEVLRPWIAKKVTQYVGQEDDIVISMVMAELDKADVDPRKMQVNLTGFLERNTGAFMGDLWDLCLSAQDNFRIVDGKPVKGMPTQLIAEKEEEIARMNKEIQMRAKKIQEEQERARERQRDDERQREERHLDKERERQLRRQLEEQQASGVKGKEDRGERDRDRERERERERERRSRRSRSRSGSRDRARPKERKASRSRDRDSRWDERERESRRDRSRSRDRL